MTLQEKLVPGNMILAVGNIASLFFIVFHICFVYEKHVIPVGEYFHYFVSVHFLNPIHALCPPNPSDVDRAQVISFLTASFGV